jgi:hypothetical protein
VAESVEKHELVGAGVGAVNRAAEEADRGLLAPSSMASYMSGLNLLGGMKENWQKL